MEGKQLSFLSETEWVKLISPQFTRQKNRAEWHLRKTRLGAIRADLNDGLEMTDDGFPTITPYFGYPECPMIGFNEALRSQEYDYWVQWFVDDVCFEQIWNPKYTERDLAILSRFRGSFTPDFTLWPNLSPIQEQFNIFRSRTIGQKLQRLDVPIIPTVGWSTRRSFDYFISGLSEGGTVAISTNGVLKRLVSQRLFREGVFEIERKLKSEIIVIYGEKMELKTKTRQIWIPNNNIVKLRSLSDISKK